MRSSSTIGKMKNLHRLFTLKWLLVLFAQQIASFSCHRLKTMQFCGFRAQCSCELPVKSPLSSCFAAAHGTNVLDWQLMRTSCSQNNTFPVQNLACEGHFTCAQCWSHAKFASVVKSVCADKWLQASWLIVEPP